MPTISEWQKRFQDMDAGAPVTPGIITSMKSRLRGQRGATYAEIELLEDKTTYSIVRTSWNVTQEMHDKGLAFLKRQKLSERNRAIVENADKFAFVGFAELVRGMNYILVPVYRCFDKQGEWFDYYAVSWQSCLPGTPRFGVLCESGDR